MIKILSKSKQVILGLTNESKHNPIFTNPTYKNRESKKPKYTRDIKVYRVSEPYRISPLVKSGIRMFRVENKEGFVGYTLSYHQESGMTECKTIPATVRVAFDKVNKLLKLVGKDAVGCWEPQITPLYKRGELIKLNKGGISLSDYITTRKELKNVKKNKVGN